MTVAHDWIQDRGQWPRPAHGQIFFLLFLPAAIGSVCIGHLMEEFLCALPGLDGIPYRSFLPGSQAHTCRSLWWVTTLSSHLWTRDDSSVGIDHLKNSHEIRGSGLSMFFTYHSWRIMANQNQLHKVQLYGCQWRWTSPFRWILQMGRLEETESQLKFFAKKKSFFCHLFCQLCLILTSFFWSFP